MGWRSAGIVAALVGATSLVSLWWKRGELSNELAGELASRGTHRTRGSGVRLATLLKLRLTWLAFSFFFFSTLVFGALQNFAPPLLRDLYGLSLAAATSGLTAYLFGSAAGLLATAPLIFGMLLDAGKTQSVFVGVSIALGLAIIAAQAVAIEARRV